jgi:hypothetical protein
MTPPELPLISGTKASEGERSPMVAAHAMVERVVHESLTRDSDQSWLSPCLGRDV